MLSVMIPSNTPEYFTWFHRKEDAVHREKIHREWQHLTEEVEGIW